MKHSLHKVAINLPTTTSTESTTAATTDHLITWMKKVNNENEWKKENKERKQRKKLSIKRYPKSQYNLKNIFVQKKLWFWLNLREKKRDDDDLFLDPFDPFLST